MREDFKRRLLDQLGATSQASSFRKDHTKKHQSPRRSAKKILVIEDEPFSLEFSSTVLESDGYFVYKASSVAEGRNILFGNPDISLIITDLKMPVETGFTLLEFVHENNRFSHIPVIVLTCCSDKNIVLQAIEMGAKGYLTKPFTSDLLLRRVGEIFERGKGNILIVTENSSAAAVLRRALEADSFRVHTATSGNAAKEMVNQIDFDIFICDLILEDMTGLDLMIAVQEIRGHLPFLFMEESSMGLSEEDIRTAGGYGLLKKPYNNSEILLTVYGVFSRLKVS